MDADPNPEFQDVHAAFDAIMPWSVGRYGSQEDFDQRKAIIELDAQQTSSRGQGYAPIAWAGYSYRDAGKFNQIKRNCGAFFRHQMEFNLNTTGITFHYIAMFDEVQEGTAIFKFAANEDESAEGPPFLTTSIDSPLDSPLRAVCEQGDLYLRLVRNYTIRAHQLASTVVV